MLSDMNLSFLFQSEIPHSFLHSFQFVNLTITTFYRTPPPVVKEDDGLNMAIFLQLKNYVYNYNE